MIVDTSALIAILRDEPEAASMGEALLTADNVRMSAGTWIELAAVTSSGDEISYAGLLHLMSAFAIRIEPVTVRQAEIGHQAYRTFGKGNHPARLNLGDCFAYALARETGEPLLFKGDDFPRTDIRPALRSSPSAT